MLAAVPAEQARILEMFNLALAMASSAQRNIPAPLASYFDKVLAQARQLLIAPDAIQDAVLPEAIQLALEIRSDEDIRSAMQQVSSITQISPEQAKQALASLERAVAS